MPETPLLASRLNPKLSRRKAAKWVLNDAFREFATHLADVGTSEDPEPVHHTRIGWRRFKTALWLFKPTLATTAKPPTAPLRPLLGGLGKLRNLEVALNETLPPLAQAYIAGDAHRAGAWQALLQTLTQAAHQQRQAVRATLQQASTQHSLQATTQWLKDLPIAKRPPGANTKIAGTLHQWARDRVAHLHKELQAQRKLAVDAESQHRTRILAKRMRYAIEALHPLLPVLHTRQWYAQAREIQDFIGSARDITLASALVDELSLKGGPADFLRGVQYQSCKACA
jgi:CHAD domain-containing protein